MNISALRCSICHAPYNVATGFPTCTHSDYNDPKPVVHTPQPDEALLLLAEGVKHVQAFGHMSEHSTDCFWCDWQHRCKDYLARPPAPAPVGQWRPISETSMPPIDEWAAVWIKDDDGEGAGIHLGDKDEELQDFLNANVTHWMPLPPPPAQPR